MVAFNRVVIAGTLASGAEIWSTSVAVADPTGPPVILAGDLTAWAVAVAAELPTTVGSSALGTALSSNGRVTEIRCYYYPDTNAPAASVGIATASVPGTGTASQPLQSSAVLSLRTGLAGRRYRGRMYWPSQNLAPSNLGTYTSSSALGLAQAGAALIQNIVAEVPVAGSFSAVVVSAAADEVTVVTEVAVGNVPDTQRRRRNNLLETYQTQAV